MSVTCPECKSVYPDDMARCPNCGKGLEEPKEKPKTKLEKIEVKPKEVKAETEILPQKATWKLEKQYIIDNIGIEILNLEEENKKFVSLTKFKKDKNLVIPIERAEEIGKKLIQVAKEV